MTQDKPYGSLTGSAGAKQRNQEHDRDELMHGQGANPKPTKAALSARTSCPAGYATTGMEKAMGASADKIHPPRKR